jgi:lipoprotein-anchoring transpeptidase ErfK/SrfK
MRFPALPPLLATLLLSAPGALAAQSASPQNAAPQGLVTHEELLAATLRAAGMASVDPFPTEPTSRADSVAWQRARAAAERATGRRIVISLYERRIWLLDGADTLLSAPAGVGRGVVTYPDGRTRDFSTPRGVRRVLARDTAPVWVPPEWHYAETARREDRKLATLRRGEEMRLSDGTRLVVRGREVGRVLADGTFEAAEPGAILVFDNTIFIPPLGTESRTVRGALGAFRLDLGDGYLIHGTPEKDSIGISSTHGCIRMDDDALAELYARAPVGTAVYIY